MNISIKYDIVKCKNNIILVHYLLITIWHHNEKASKLKWCANRECLTGEYTVQGDEVSTGMGLEELSYKLNTI